MNDNTIVAGTEFVQPLRVDTILFHLNAFELIDSSIDPSLQIVFVDKSANYPNSNVDLVCNLDIDPEHVPVLTQILRKMGYKRFSTTYITYADVYPMKCKSVDSKFVSAIDPTQPGGTLKKFIVTLNVPGLCHKILEAERIELERMAKHE